MAIKMLNMDCMEYMRTVPDKYFDLAIVDPPYGIGVNVSMGRRKGQAHSGHHKYAGEDKAPPQQDYFSELERISKKHIIWGANHFIDNFPFSANQPCWIMWDKKFSSEVSFAQFELAWTNLGGTCKKFDESPNDASRIHPTQKPVKLYQWLLQNYAKPEFKILDTHLGSGSSAIAAHYFGVAEFVGTELDEDYYKACCERFENATAQEALF